MILAFASELLASAKMNLAVAWKVRAFSRMTQKVAAIILALACML